MVANLINCLLGLAVTYVSIFGMPATVRLPWLLIIGGILIVVLAMLARRSDYSGWQSGTNIVLGLILIAVSAAGTVAPIISPLVMFWIELWVGLTVASLALWAALYHPERGPGLSGTGL